MPRPLREPPSIAPSSSTTLLAAPPRNRVHSSKARSMVSSQIPQAPPRNSDRGSQWRNSHTNARLTLPCLPPCTHPSQRDDMHLLGQSPRDCTLLSCAPSRKHGLVFRYFLRRIHVTFVDLRSQYPVFGKHIRISRKPAVSVTRLRETHPHQLQHPRLDVAALALAMP
jgi:hypothetical protein